MVIRLLALLGEELVELVQSVCDVVISAVDPVEVGYAGFLADSLSSAVNREIIRQATDEGKGIAGDFGLHDTGDTPLAILAEPTRGRGYETSPP